MGKGYDKHPLKTIAAIIAAVIVLSAVSTFASYRELELFDQAYEYYLSYQPEKALDSFALFMNEFPKSPAKDAAMFWMGKSMLSLKRTDDAKSIFKKIKQDFPSSPLRKYADKELEKLETADEMMSTRAMITEQDNKYKPQTLQAKTDNATDVTTPPHPETPEMNDKRVSEEATGKTGKEEQLATAGITIASQIENYEPQILQAKTDNATDVTAPPHAETPEGNNKRVSELTSETGKKEEQAAADISISSQNEKNEPQILQAKTDNATDVTAPPHPETPEGNNKRVSESTSEAGNKEEQSAADISISSQNEKNEIQIPQVRTDNTTDVTTPPSSETQEGNDKQVSEEATGKTGKEEQLATAGITIASQIENYESQILQAKTGNATNVITPSPSEAQEGNDKQVPEPSSGTGKKEDKEREPASSVERLEQQSASDVPLNGNGSSVEALNTSPSVQANKQNNPESETEVFLFLSRYTGAYERGDIAAFLDLFSKDAVENNSLSYSDIRQFYARNFKASRYRYALENVVIEDRGDSVIVGGNYRIMSADGVTLKAHGFIQWALTRNEGSLKIMRIDYEKK